MRFNTYIGVDYSGAATPTHRTPTLQVYHADVTREPQPVLTPAASESKCRNWNRSELAEWLEATLQQEAVIVGIDHGFSFPCSYFDRYKLRTWDEFLNDFVQHWPTIGREATVEAFRAKSQRSGDARDLRIAERWTASAKSVFQFDVQGSVAKSTHAGLPYIHRFRKLNPKIHFWPFDGWQPPSNSCVVAEVWPSIFRHRYSRDTRSIDQQDAYSICRWLKEMDSMGELERFFTPPLNQAEREVANLEGWILGVT